MHFAFAALIGYDGFVTGGYKIYLSGRITSLHFQLRSLSKSMIRFNLLRAF